MKPLFLLPPLAALLLTAFLLTRPAPPARWSDPATWGGAVPKAGASVTIPKGKDVLLDVSPPPLRSLTISGALVFADRDLSLQAAEINVPGRLQIGTHAAPFTHHALVTLTAASGGVKCLSVTGQLELHGRDAGQTWTHLAQTAAAGTRRLMLADTAAWQPGDHLVLASTDFDPAEAEEVTVTQNAGHTLTLAAPLRFAHWGRVTDGIDERAEVGLLTHSIVIEGDAASARDGLGGQIMVMRGGAAHVEGVELTRMGRAGQMGAYPFHFHRAGDQTGSYLRECSVHTCYNRAVTLHGTNNVRVQDNVAYDTVGHAYFLEDGIETGNVLKHNLGVLTRRAKPGQALLPSDLTPATFWVTNPANILRGNAAAGSDGDGYWYSLPAHVTGLSRTPATDRARSPRRLALSEFTGNSAHSNDNDGLFVDNGPNPAGTYGSPDYNPPAEAVFDRMTAWKNRRRGVWLRGSPLTLAHACLADNSIGATLACSQSVVRDSLVVGETENIGPLSGRLPKPAEPHSPRVGFEFYDGLVGVSGTTFAHFRPQPGRPAGALSCVRYTPFFVDPRNWVKDLHFADAARVYFAPPPGHPAGALGADGYRSAAFMDTDGSVSGQAGTAIAVPNPLLGLAAPGPGAGCVTTRAPLGKLFVDNRDLRPAAISPLLVSAGPGRKLAVYGSPPEGDRPATNFGVSVPVNHDYTLRFAGHSPGLLRLTLRCCPPGSWVRLHLPGRAPVTLTVPPGGDTATVRIDE